MSNQLPLEVYKRIIEHMQPMCENPPLAALARTSRTLQPIAEQRLYGSLYLVGARTLHAILQAFISRPVRGSYPRQIFIRPSERERTPQAYWTALSEVLKLGGADLELFCIFSSDAEASSASWVLRNLRNIHGRLTVLRVPFWWDPELVRFLQSDSVRGLTRLETGEDVADVPLGAQQLPNSLRLNRDALPNLTMVDAPPSILSFLVPGRPVTHVRFRSGSITLQSLPPPLELMKDCLARTAAPKGILALDMGDISSLHPLETYSIEVLELAPSFLPHLKFIGTINFPWTKDIPATRIHKPLLRLSELHILEFSVSHIHPPVDTYWELSVASDFRIFSPSLRELTFWQAYDRHRWIWLEHEADFVLASPQDPYAGWGGIQ